MAWTVVSGKRRSKRLDVSVAPNWNNRLGQVGIENKQFQSLSHDSQIQRIEEVSKLVRSRMRDLTDKELPKSLTQLLMTSLKFVSSETSEVDVVCYGIGSLCSSRSAQLQCAVLLLILESLDCKGRRFIYDPVMNQIEKAVVIGFGFELIDKNEEAKRCIRKVDSLREAKTSPFLQPNLRSELSDAAAAPSSLASTVPTVFFMPHCGRTLSNNVVWANWGPNLSKVLLIGNSFSSSANKKPIPSAMQAVMPFVTEHTMPDYDNAFNDTCLHLFRLPEYLWAERPSEVVLAHESLDTEILTLAMMEQPELQLPSSEPKSWSDLQSNSRTNHRTSKCKTELQSELKSKPKSKAELRSSQKGIQTELQVEAG